jgi:hypothetical protein
MYFRIKKEFSIGEAHTEHNFTRNKNIIHPRIKRLISKILTAEKRRKSRRLLLKRHWNPLYQP